MKLHRILALSTVILILGTIFASGPLVGVSLTTEEDQFEPSSGTINATVVSTPETATLEAANYGIEKYYLRLPPAELQVDSVNGQATVSYDLVIHELDYTRSSVRFLDSSIQGSYQLKFEQASLQKDRIERDEFDGTLRIVVLNGDADRTVIETDIRIEVRE